MKINVYIVLCILLFILCIVLFYFYKKDNQIKDILYAWEQKVPNGNITFDGIGDYKNDYYLSLDSNDNHSTHIHFITDTPNCYLCYVVKKHNKHSRLYIIDTNKDPSLIVDEMLTNLRQMKI